MRWSFGVGERCASEASHTRSPRGCHSMAVFNWASYFLSAEWGRSANDRRNKFDLRGTILRVYTKLRRAQRTPDPISSR
jgi:hypothetical protein